jgi:hypothetical protein
MHILFSVTFFSNLQVGVFVAAVVKTSVVDSVAVCMSLNQFNRQKIPFKREIRIGLIQLRYDF